MSEATFIPAAPVEVDRSSVDISIDSRGIRIYFNPALPEEAHKPSRMELMAAGALMGIAGVLTGKGSDDILAAMCQFSKAARTKGRR